MINKYKVSENRLSIMEIERFAVHDGQIGRAHV